MLLGATLPFTLIFWAGPVAILQASIVSIVTFLVIYFAARRLGLDQQLSAVLGAGGAVCGVSASIAVAGAVGAKKEYAPIAITVVILWAIVMIFVLPFVARLLNLPTGVAGAWIGTSEFADAAGIAAAQTYGGFAGHGRDHRHERSGGLVLHADESRRPRCLDRHLGLCARHHLDDALGADGVRARKPDAAEIWWRFPKFVIGFLLASIIVTLVAQNYTQAAFTKQVTPVLVAPIKDLRTWAFIFCFLSIGFTTRFRELAHAGTKPFAAFSAGVVVNVLLGFVLSAYRLRDALAKSRALDDGLASRQATIPRDARGAALPQLRAFHQRSAPARRGDARPCQPEFGLWLRARGRRPLPASRSLCAGEFLMRGFFGDKCGGSGGGTRTPDTRIMIPLL